VVKAGLTLGFGGAIMEVRGNLWINVGKTS